MGKFVLIFLLCAFVALCMTEEVKKETSTLDELQATIEARLKEVKEYIGTHVDEDKLKEFVDKFAENGKKFLADTQASIQNLNEKKE
ncbi:uncharacterized protein Dvir_GJ13474, isoform B [Drosophila virilis]|uniref:Uncharacterized protein, isoform B n=1 Tax=Drosophila virilis TaxID=7244 RepID=A0A0Q9WJ42_DROVI|nr:uncharacterized protein Dvir_GJ13474, isoform B [Drosophila virilis]